MRALDWALTGNHGLRAGWSVLIFVILYRLFSLVLGSIAVTLDPRLATLSYTATLAILSELIPFLAVMGSAALVARMERRKLLDYNLAGRRRARHFIAGLATGFAALSVLVGALACGGWLQFGPVALAGSAIFKYAALWACAFLLVGCVEEGIFRCYLQFTLTRGINLWWGLGIVAVLCLDVFLRSRGNVGIVALLWLDPLPAITGNSYLGVYAVALLGLAGCLALRLKRPQGAGFWQAAWVTSTLFGFIHIGNGGENWIGIFAAAAIGFVFCVSIRVTGSAWWAIGCHAAWDWAETYFYGTADSGLQARGHYLTATPSGATLWSGGADGPEGSLLVLGAILLMLVPLIALRERHPALPVSENL